MTAFFHELAEQISRHPKFFLIDDYEISFQRVQTQRLYWQDGQLRKVWGDEDLWISLRVLFQGKPGVSIGTSKRPRTLHTLVEQALFSARFSTPDPFFKFPLLRIPETFYASKSSVPWEDYGCPWEKVASPVQNWIAEEGIRERFLKRKFEKHDYYFFRKFVAWEYISEKPSLFSLLNERKESPLFSPDQITSSLRRFKEKEDWCQSQNIEPIQISKYPIVFSPKASCALLSYVSPYFLAPYRESYESLPKKELITLPSFLSLIESSCEPTSVYAHPFDAEGITGRETKLIRQGRVLDTLCDTYFGAKENRVSTSNRSRWLIDERQSITPNQMTLQTESPQFALEDFKLGFYIDTISSIKETDPQKIVLEGLGFQVEREWNPQAKYFKVEVEGGWISLLKRIDALGGDVEFYNRFGSPSVFIKNFP